MKHRADQDLVDEAWRIAVRDAELELERARLAFQSARTPYARRKALRRLEAARARRPR